MSCGRPRDSTRGTLESRRSGRLSPPSSGSACGPTAWRRMAPACAPARLASASWPASGSLARRTVRTSAACGRSHGSSLNHERFGWFLNRLDAVRRTVAAERLQDAVAPELAGTLGSDESLLPRALQHLQEAVHLDPASPARRLSLVAFALAHRAEIPAARDDRRPGVPGGDPPGSRSPAGRCPAPHGPGGRARPAVARRAPGRGDARGPRADSRGPGPRVDGGDGAGGRDCHRLDARRRRPPCTSLAPASCCAAEAAPWRWARPDRRSCFAPGDADVFAVLAEAYEANGLLGEAEAAIGSALAMSGDGDPRKLKRVSGPPGVAPGPAG